MDQLEEILERMKNHSTNLCRNAETPETSRDSDVCPICEGREWILKIKDGVEIAVPCKCRRKRSCQGGCDSQIYRRHSVGWI